MARILTEFYCAKIGGGCGGYFNVYLRTNMYGNYTIQCPNCTHHHFRFIQSGVVTNDRHYERAGQSEVIVGLKSTFSNTPSHECPEYNRSRFTLYQGS
jgi:hypothetical protein